MADEDDSPIRLTRSLSARLRRKEQVARGEAVPDMPDDTLPAGMDDPAAEPDEEAVLSDEELLAKYGVEDPEVIEDEDKLDTLLQGQFPDRIRQMALRRMWRLNPLFRFADEMVEYGENYTDAATVIDGMQTAYQVGKGYLQKAFDAVEDEGADIETPSGTKEPAGGAPDTPRRDSAPSPAEDSRDAGETEPEDTAAPAVANDAQKPEMASDTRLEEGRAGSEEEIEPAPPRPRRMTFRKPA